MHKPGNEDGTRRVLGNVNGSQGPGKGEMMRSRAMWMGEGVGVVKRAEARRGACVRACVRGCVDADWSASKYLGWVVSLLLPAMQTSLNGPVNRSIG